MVIERPLKREADFMHLRKVILRETTDGPVPIIELLADVEVLSETTGMEPPRED